MLCFNIGVYESNTLFTLGAFHLVRTQFYMLSGPIHSLLACNAQWKCMGGLTPPTPPRCVCTKWKAPWCKVNMSPIYQQTVSESMFCLDPRIQYSRVWSFFAENYTENTGKRGKPFFTTDPKAESITKFPFLFAMRSTTFQGISVLAANPQYAA